MISVYSKKMPAKCEHYKPFTRVDLQKHADEYEIDATVRQIYNTVLHDAQNRYSRQTRFVMPPYDVGAGMNVEQYSNNLNEILDRCKYIFPDCIVEFEETTYYLYIVIKWD